MLRLKLFSLRLTVFISVFIAKLNGENAFLNRLAQLKEYKNSTELSSAKKIADEAFMEATALINLYGYPAENHTITTEDGYILTNHRIPRGKEDDNKTRRPPVLLIHGMSCDAKQWFNNGRDSFAFVLADAGYDVWLGNLRGGSFSNHLNYSKKSKEYWDYSFEQHSELDVPPLIDHILTTTNYSKLVYIGQSMGTTIGFVLLAAKPEYNEKISGVIAISPVLIPHYVTAFPAEFIKYLKALKVINDLRGKYSLFTVDDQIQRLTVMACGLIDPIICQLGFTLIAGFNPYSMNKTRLPIISVHCSAGTSIKNALHFFQVIAKQRVTRFDYGTLANLQRYGSVKPPELDVLNITVPIVLYYSANDVAATPLDVAVLRRHLRTVVGVELFPIPLATHNDFMFARDAKSLAYDTVLNYVHNFCQEN